jgi:ATP-dependent Clp protease protease subunit
MEVGRKRSYSNANIMRENIIFGGSKPKKVKGNSEIGDDEAPDFSKLFRHQDEDSCYTVDNNIYFNDDISMDTVSALNKEIRQLQNKLLGVSIKMGIEPPPIKLHITTYGGSVHAAFSAIGCIKSSKVPVHTIIDGYVASAGTLMSVCGVKRYMHRHSSMLIHELRSGSWGKMSVIEEEVDNLKKMMVKIKDIYTEHTKLKKKDLDAILKKDNDWYAEPLNPESFRQDSQCTAPRVAHTVPANTPIGAL